MDPFPSPSIEDGHRHLEEVCSDSSGSDAAIRAYSVRRRWRKKQCRAAFASWRSVIKRQALNSSLSRLCTYLVTQSHLFIWLDATVGKLQYVASCHRALMFFKRVLSYKAFFEMRALTSRSRKVSIVSGVIQANQLLSMKRRCFQSWTGTYESLVAQNIVVLRRCRSITQQSLRCWMSIARSTYYHKTRLLSVSVYQFAVCQLRSNLRHQVETKRQWRLISVGLHSWCAQAQAAVASRNRTVSRWVFALWIHVVKELRIQRERAAEKQASILATSILEADQTIGELDDSVFPASHNEEALRAVTETPDLASELQNLSEQVLGSSAHRNSVLDQHSQSETVAQIWAKIALIRVELNNIKLEMQRG